MQALDGGALQGQSKREAESRPAGNVDGHADAADARIALLKIEGVTLFSNVARWA